MEELTLQDLKALVEANSRAIGRLEELQAQDREQLLLSRKQWQEEIAASRREHDRVIASIERSMTNLNQQLGHLGNQIGELTEAAFYPSLERALREGFHMEVIAPNVIARRQGEELELDLLAYANEEVNTVFDVEVKTELDQAALDQILDHLQRFPRFFREHRGKKLYGILAAVKIPPGLRKQALRNGLYLATIRDDGFDVLRPPGFEPRAFPN